MEKIKLATGKEMDVESCLCDVRRGILYITVPNATFESVLTIFNDPIATETIESGINRYEHFSRMVQLQDQGDHHIRVNLEAVK